MNRVQREIFLGTFLTLLSAGILIVMGLREIDRLAEYENTQKASQIEFGASVFDANCTRCHGSQAQGSALAPCLRCDELFTSRLDEVGWEGSLKDYIVSVVTTGRQVSTRPELYPGGGKPAMPTWSEKFGGPLRDDQIRAVATFIMNYEPYALGELPTPVPLAPLEFASDDPVARGRFAFSEAGCVACHTVTGLSTGEVGPVLDGLASRAGDRIEGYSAEEYIRESIMDPNAFIVEGYQPDVMVQDFAQTLSSETIDDILAFLLTLE